MQHALSDVTNHPQEPRHLTHADQLSLSNTRNKSRSSKPCIDELQRQPPGQQLGGKAHPDKPAQAQLQPSAAAMAHAPARAGVHTSEASMPDLHAPEGSGMAAAQAVSIPAPTAESQVRASKPSAPTGPANPMGPSPMAAQADQGDPASRIAAASIPRSQGTHLPAQRSRGPEFPVKRRGKQGRRLVSQRPDGHPGPEAETTATMPETVLRGKDTMPFVIHRLLHFWLRQSACMHKAPLFCTLAAPRVAVSQQHEVLQIQCQPIINRQS